MLAAGARAGQPRVAVFDFELVDTSLEGATYGPRVDQQLRLAQIADQLRRVISLRSVDMRGNTDETWSRAIDWLVHHDLLAPPGQGVF